MTGPADPPLAADGHGSQPGGRRAPGPERSVGARLPRKVRPPARVVPRSGLAVWRTRQGLAVLAVGSSTCPAYPVAVTLEATDGPSGRPRVRVELDDAYPGRPCTRDLVPTTHVVALPEGAPGRGHLEVLLVRGDVREGFVVH